MRYPAFGQMSHCGHNGSGYRNSLRSRGRNKYSFKDFIEHKLAITSAHHLMALVIASGLPEPLFLIALLMNFHLVSLILAYRETSYNKHPVIPQVLYPYP